MEYMGVGPNATPEAQQERDLLDELITSQFDTDEEKELARTPAWREHEDEFHVR